MKKTQKILIISGLLCRKRFRWNSNLCWKVKFYFVIKNFLNHHYLWRAFHEGDQLPAKVSILKIVTMTIKLTFEIYFCDKGDSIETGVLRFPQWIRNFQAKVKISFWCRSKNKTTLNIFSFEILSGTGFTWVGSSNGHVPAGAVLAGNTSTGEPLYVSWFAFFDHNVSLNFF